MISSYYYDKSAIISTNIGLYINRWNRNTSKIISGWLLNSFFHTKINYGVYMKVYDAFISIVHNMLYNTLYRYDIAGTLLKVFEIM